ncbi:glycosyltransferase family 4 protein [Roseobacter litoralis]|uniref:Gylcosyl transferase-like protein n=1 Tax=Roseobacter litoralis (strain ATCC 49566 / DSM 6996 / JCM 21268 / NBRC 15278 / OCh 149) TaxID=391595 RepID=F7ZML4_ROSLO|nr:glycosyltransferase family 4 protein [Roseobacter litoralis]AEI96551.1 gylcosyl transferase-like protein [Roseobacter litoralis Och 149]
MPDTLRIVIIAPSLDGNDLSEPEWAYRWVEALSRMADVTCLASSRIGAVPLAEQLPRARVVTWPEIPFLYRKLERFNAQVKPALPLFHAQARRWIKHAQRNGETFHIGHQILPQGMRHTTPLRNLGFPYVVGPLGGGLKTPAGFEKEVQATSSISARLRQIDDVRLSYDPFLRAGYAGADLVLGVAPYVVARLAPVGIRRFHALPERGYGNFAPERTRQSEVGTLTLFHAGRTIRTKGLRDTVRAMARLRDLPNVRLVSAGDGEDLTNCRAEADRLGVADRITFLGKIPREKVEEYYAASDVFCFPSFREPMGGVFFEAMAHGLPIVTAANGGPDFLIDDTSGIRVPVTTPDDFANGIAEAVRALAMDPALRLKLGQGSRERLHSFGSWDDKAELMLSFYRDIIARRAEGMT